MSGAAHFFLPWLWRISPRYQVGTLQFPQRLPQPCGADQPFCLSDTVRHCCPRKASPSLRLNMHIESIENSTRTLSTWPPWMVLVYRHVEVYRPFLYCIVSFVSSTILRVQCVRMSFVDLVGLMICEALNLGVFLDWIEKVRADSQINMETGEIVWSVGASILLLCASVFWICLSLWIAVLCRGCGWQANDNLQHNSSSVSIWVVHMQSAFCFPWLRIAVLCVPHSWNSLVRHVCMHVELVDGSQLRGTSRAWVLIVDTCAMQCASFSWYCFHRPLIHKMLIMLLMIHVEWWHKLLVCYAMRIYLLVLNS